MCVDYLLDTLERASGTWWRSREEFRGRDLGRLDFDAFDREDLRRVSQFVEFARQQPEWFDVLAIPEAEQISLGDRVIYEYLQDHVSDFVPGDMILIGGHVPWDPTPYVHYHSFFVFDSDPITGMPTILSGNPGTPRLVPLSWEFERTPKRTLRYRIRPNAAWLENVVGSGADDQPTAPPLAYVTP